MDSTKLENSFGVTCIGIELEVVKVGCRRKKKSVKMTLKLRSSPCDLGRTAQKRWGLPVASASEVGLAGAGEVWLAGTGEEGLVAGAVLLWLILEAFHNHLKMVI